MWKLLNKSFWSGMFWPPVVGDGDVVRWPEGICETGLQGTVTAHGLTGESPSHGLTGTWERRGLRHDCE